MNKLNIFGSLSRTGYGISTLNIAKALHKQGVDISVLAMGNANVNDAEEKALVEEWLAKGQMLDTSAPCLKIWHQNALHTTICNSKYYAMPIFELTRFNDQEKHHLKCPDQLIVNSKWAAEVVEDQTGLKAEIVPLGVDTSIFSSASTPRSPDCNFLNVGKWEVRKGHDILPEIFNKAFTPKDNVKLNLMPYNPFLNQEEQHKWVLKYKNTPMGDKIFILDPVNTHLELAQIMQHCDCGVFPSRGEGWNLELLEMLACGKPVITTYYSAHTEFCTEDNALLTHPTSLEDAHDGKWFHGQGQWAHLLDENVDEMVEHMRHIYKEWNGGLDILNKAGIKTAEKFTWENSAKILQSVCL